MTIKFLSIIRPGNGIISAMGVLTGYIIAEPALGISSELLLAMIAAFLITGAGNLVNDYFDFEVDKKPGKNRAIELGIGKKQLLNYSIVLFALGIGLTLFITMHATIIAAIVSLLVIVYAAKMRKQKYIGNWLVALGTALTLVFGASISMEYSAVFVLAASALFANAGREITKDLEDMKGDKGEKTTLPMLLSFEQVKIIIIANYAAAILFAIAAFTNNLINGPLYVPLLIISAVVFLYSWKLVAEKKFPEAQKWSKYGMVMALAAFIGGSL